MLSDVLEPAGRAEAQVPTFTWQLSTTGDNQLVKVLPTRFNHVMPKLKESDYGYIVFDMPPVTQTSATPRAASRMDLALESPVVDLERFTTRILKRLPELSNSGSLPGRAGGGPIHLNPNEGEYDVQP